MIASHAPGVVTFTHVDLTAMRKPFCADPDSLFQGLSFRPSPWGTNLRSELGQSSWPGMLHFSSVIGTEAVTSPLTTGYQETE